LFETTTDAKEQGQDFQLIATRSSGKADGESTTYLATYMSRMHVQLKANRSCTLYGSIAEKVEIDGN
jgi:hypothetical protein